MVKDNLMDETELKEARSNLLAIQVMKWQDEGNPKFISLWPKLKSDMVPSDVRRVMDHMHTRKSAPPAAKKEIKKEIRKEDGGGGGFGGDAGAGTVFTSTNSGIFSPTYGGSSAKHRTSVQDKKKKRKGKKSGVEKLGQWLTDYSPERKSLSKGTATEFAVDVLFDVSKEYKMKDPKLRNKVDTKLPENETVTNYRPKILDWKKNDYENAGALHYEKAADTESSDEVGQITKEQSGYRPATSFEKGEKVMCSSCIFFEDDGACHIVTGSIEADGWCRLFDSENSPKPAKDEVVEGKDIEKARDLEDYFSNKYPMQSDKLKRRLIREAVFPRECAGCRVGEWKGSVVPLELNHKDGDHGNNAKSNLELLCPNCHALTPHYRVKKPGSKSAIDLHGGAPKGDPRRDKSLDKELRKIQGYGTEEDDPQFTETEVDTEESDVAAREQKEFMDKLKGTTAKHVGDDKDDSDEKSGVLAADTEFGPEIRLSDDFEEGSAIRELMKSDAAFDEIVRDIYKE